MAQPREPPTPTPHHERGRNEHAPERPRRRDTRTPHRRRVRPRVPPR
jgi:hypothetical protein